MSLAVNRTSVSNLNLTTENVAENWMSASGRTRVDGSWKNVRATARRNRTRVPREHTAAFTRRGTELQALHCDHAGIQW